MQMTLAVREEIGSLPALEQRTVPRVPAMEDLAVDVDEKRPEDLTVIRSQEGQARLCECAIVDRYAAFLSGAADFVSVRTEQIEQVIDVDQCLRNDPMRKALCSGGEVSVAESPDEKQKSGRQEENRSAEALMPHRGMVGLVQRFCNVIRQLASQARSPIAGGFAPEMALFGSGVTERQAAVDGNHRARHV